MSRRTPYHTILPEGTHVAPRGLECVFEYNGLVMHDLRRPDRYRLTRVSGLDDAEVRDHRGSNPGRDGATAFSSLYGGRTITLQGYVEAGNLSRLRQMWAEMKAAFDDVTSEHELHMRWYDWRDEFQDPSSLVLQDYDIGAGSSSISASGGSLVTSSTAPKELAVSARSYVDAEVTLEHMTGTPTTGYETGPSLCRLDAQNFLFVTITAAGTLSIYKKDNNTNTSLDSAATTALSAATAYYTQIRKVGNVIYARHFNTPAAFQSDAPTLQRTYTLAGADAIKFGAGVSGRAGAFWIPGATSAKLNSIDVQALNPGDLVVSCKKVQKVEGDEQWDGLRYRRPFMITLQSQSSLLVSRQPSSISGAVASSSLTFPAGGAGIPFSGDGMIVFGGPLGTATNLGYAPIEPIVRLSGPLTNPAVVNATNDTRVVVDGELLSGETLTVDCYRRTAVDQSGANRYAMLARENDWLCLARGANAINAGADEIGGTATVEWRHAFR